MACLRCSSGAPLSLSYASPIDKVIFPAPESSYDDQNAPWKSNEIIWLRDPAEGYQFPVVVMEPSGCKPDRLIIYLHGNACDIGGVYENLQGDATNWRAVIALTEYPGYGMSPGVATAESIDRHARTTYDHFVKNLGVHPSRVILYGCSVGTGPAAKLAMALQHDGTPAGGLVMQSPYTSIREAAAALVGFVAYILFERWDNMKYARQSQLPWLIIHGTADEVIPFVHSCNLREEREKAKLPVRFHAQMGASHNNYDPRRDLTVPVKEYLDAHHKVEALEGTMALDVVRESGGWGKRLPPKRGASGVGVVSGEPQSSSPRREEMT